MRPLLNLLDDYHTQYDQLDDPKRTAAVNKIVEAIKACEDLETLLAANNSIQKDHKLCEAAWFKKAPAARVLGELKIRLALLIFQKILTNPLPPLELSADAHNKIVGCLARQRSTLSTGATKSLGSLRSVSGNPKCYYRIERSSANNQAQLCVTIDGQETLSGSFDLSAENLALINQQQVQGEQKAELVTAFKENDESLLQTACSSDDAAIAQLSKFCLALFLLDGNTNEKFQRALQLLRELPDANDFRGIPELGQLLDDDRNSRYTQARTFAHTSDIQTLIPLLKETPRLFQFLNKETFDWLRDRDLIRVATDLPEHLTDIVGDNLSLLFKILLNPTEKLLEENPAFRQQALKLLAHNSEALYQQLAENPALFQSAVVQLHFHTPEHAIACSAKLPQHLADIVNRNPRRLLTLLSSATGKPRETDSEFQRQAMEILFQNTQALYNALWKYPPLFRSFVVQQFFTSFEELKAFFEAKEIAPITQAFILNLMPHIAPSDEQKQSLVTRGVFSTNTVSVESIRSALPTRTEALPPPNLAEELLWQEALTAAETPEQLTEILASNVAAQSNFIDLFDATWKLFVRCIQEDDRQRLLLPRLTEEIWNALLDHDTFMAWLGKKGLPHFWAIFSFLSDTQRGYLLCNHNQLLQSAQESATQGLPPADAWQRYSQLTQAVSTRVPAGQEKAVIVLCRVLDTPAKFLSFCQRHPKQHAEISTHWLQDHSLTGMEVVTFLETLHPSEYQTFLSNPSIKIDTIETLEAVVNTVNEPCALWLLCETEVLTRWQTPLDSMLRLSKERPLWLASWLTQQGDKAITSFGDLKKILTQHPALAPMLRTDIERYATERAAHTRKLLPRAVRGFLPAPAPKAASARPEKRPRSASLPSAHDKAARRRPARPAPVASPKAKRRKVPDSDTTDAPGEGLAVGGGAIPTPPPPPPALIAGTVDEQRGGPAVGDGAIPQPPPPPPPAPNPVVADAAAATRTPKRRRSPSPTTPAGNTRSRKGKGKLLRGDAAGAGATAAPSPRKRQRRDLPDASGEVSAAGPAVAGNPPIPAAETTARITGILRARGASAADATAATNGMAALMRGIQNGIGLRSVPEEERGSPSRRNRRRSTGESQGAGAADAGNDSMQESWEAQVAARRHAFSDTDDDDASDGYNSGWDDSDDANAASSPAPASLH